MYRLLLFLLCFLYAGMASASHIVGGELQLISYNPRANQFKVILRMYCDNSASGGSGATGSELRSREVNIYQKSNNAFVTSVTVEMPKDRNGNFLPPIPVNYTNAACSDGQLETVLLRYEGLISLGSQYNAPGGYYMSVEDCCRNASIANINDPFNAGYVFYLEFPRMDILSPQMNSSPYFPELGTGTTYSQGLDYLCLNEYRKFNFGATDIDGDSLVYRLVTPMAGHGNVDLTSPAPYDSVLWKSGYNINNQIPGSPPFKIDSRTGVVEVKPTGVGLTYVIGIVCIEYRNGVKLGEVRRDFQFKVVTCEINYNPELIVLNPSVINADNEVEVDLDGQVCIDFAALDSNWNWPGAIPFPSPEQIFYSYKTTLPISALSASSSGGTLGPGTNSVNTTVCITPCNQIMLERDSTFELTVIASDHRCPFYKMDSINLKVVIHVPSNDKPTTGVVPDQTDFYLLVGQTLNFDAWAADVNNSDVITLWGEGIDFNLAEKGMSFNTVTGTDSISSPFTFTPTCENLKDSDQMRDSLYRVRFIARDNSCMTAHTDTTIVRIHIEDNPTTLPDIRPTNLVTPNGDGKNDYYEFLNLPPDNCTYLFGEIEIYNVWGSAVFKSKSRNFRWDPSGLSDGMYFYRIDLNEKEFKGWIQVVR